MKPFIVGDDIRKYYVEYNDKWLIFTKRGIDIEKYPAIRNYLFNFKQKLEPRPEDWNEKENGTWPGRKAGPYKWYEIQDNVSYYREFDKPKIIYPIIAKVARFTLDKDGFYCNDKGFIVGSDSFFILGLLNSKLITYVFSHRAGKLRGGYLEWRKQDVIDLPIYSMDLTKQSDVRLHNLIADLAERLTEQTRKFSSSLKATLELLQSEYQFKKTSQKLEKLHKLGWNEFIEQLEKQKVSLTLTKKEELMAWFKDKKARLESMERQIEMLDREIDQAIYHLYELTSEEIILIESSESFST